MGRKRKGRQHPDASRTPDIRTLAKAIDKWLLFIYMYCLSCHSSDENGRKNPISTFISIFFGGNGMGSENTGLEMESGYVDARKRTNTDREPKN
jgi:hypothetical protein